MSLSKEENNKTRGKVAGLSIPYWVALLFLALSALSWAGSSVAGRAASGSVPPFSLSFIRWFFVVLCFLLIGWRETWAQRKLIIKHWPILSAFAFFGIVGFTVPYYVGLQFTVAVNASLMNASGTLWIIVTAFLMTGETITRKQTLGIVLGVLGTLIIALRANIGALDNFSINIGDVLVLVSFFSWAVYTVLLRWKPSDLGEIPFLTAICILATVMMFPFYLIDLWRGISFDTNVDNLFIITYSVIFPSFLAYIMWNKAVPIVGPSVAGMTQYLIPIFGVFLSVLILGEAIKQYHIVGIVIIFIGLWLVTSGRKLKV